MWFYLEQNLENISLLFCVCEEMGTILWFCFCCASLSCFQLISFEILIPKTYYLFEVACVVVTSDALEKDTEDQICHAIVRWTCAF